MQCPAGNESLHCMGHVKRIWYLSPVPMRAVKVQASLRICAISPEPPLLAHSSSESRGTVRQKARSLAPLNGWACAVKICQDGMLEDTNSLHGARIMLETCTCLFTFLEISSCPGALKSFFLYSRMNLFLRILLMCKLWQITHKLSRAICLICEWFAGVYT